MTPKSIAVLTAGLDALVKQTGQQIMQGGMGALQQMQEAQRDIAEAFQELQQIAASAADNVVSMPKKDDDAA